MNRAQLTLDPSVMVGPVNPCEECGAALPVLGSRARCPGCQDRHADRSVVELLRSGPSPASAAEIAAAVPGYADEEWER